MLIHFPKEDLVWFICSNKTLAWTFDCMFLGAGLVRKGQFYLGSNTLLFILSRSRLWLVDDPLYLMSHKCDWNKREVSLDSSCLIKKKAKIMIGEFKRSVFICIYYIIIIYVILYILFFILHVSFGIMLSEIHWGLHTIRLLSETSGASPCWYW